MTAQLGRDGRYNVPGRLLIDAMLRHRRSERGDRDFGRGANATTVRLHLSPIPQPADADHVLAVVRRDVPASRTSWPCQDSRTQTPCRNLARAIFHEDDLRRWKAPAAALQICENTISTFSMKRIEPPLQQALEIHVRSPRLFGEDADWSFGLRPELDRRGRNLARCRFPSSLKTLERLAERCRRGLSLAERKVETAWADPSPRRFAESSPGDFPRPSTVEQDRGVHARAKTPPLRARRGSRRTTRRTSPWPPRRRVSGRRSSGRALPLWHRRQLPARSGPCGSQTRPGTLQALDVLWRGLEPSRQPFGHHVHIGKKLACLRHGSRFFNSS